MILLKVKIGLIFLLTSFLPAYGQQIDLPVPTSSLSVTVIKTTLVTGETIQLTVIENLADGSTRDLTASTTGTTYLSKDPGQAMVTSEGLVTALAPGEARIFVRKEGRDTALETEIILTILPFDDRDGDGLSNDYETANGLNPDDPTDANADPDGDGLTNLQEFFLGSDPQSPTPRLNEDCVAAVLNRTVQVSSDGTFALGNVPVPVGAFRVRIVCELEGRIQRAQSQFVLGVPNGVTPLGPISFGVTDPIPVSLAITSPATVLTPTANGAQLVTTGILADGTRIDLTLSDTGTFYLASNPAIATVSANGFVNAVSSGTVLVTATNEGVIATISLSVNLTQDADGDGITDDFEQANAVNPGGTNLARLPGTTVASPAATCPNERLTAIP